MLVRLTYHAEGRVADPIFGMAIHDQAGTHICGPNSDFGGLHIPYVEGDGVVIYEMPSLPLLEGSYWLSVSTHNREDSEMYDYHDRAYPFRVHRGASRALWSGGAGRRVGCRGWNATEWNLNGTWLSRAATGR